MTVWKSMMTVAGAAVLTIVGLFAVAAVPGGDRLGIALNMTAYEWLQEPFEVTLEHELDQLAYPETRDLMNYLVMMHVAEHARVARLQAITRADVRGWQVPVPNLAGTVPAAQLLRSAQSSTPYQRKAVVTANQPAANNNRVLTTLVCFLFALAFAIARFSGRPRRKTHWTMPGD